MLADKQLYAFVRNQIVPLQQATIHISDLAIQRGYGVFDFLKVHEGVPLFMEDYLDRFYHSARMMELPIPLTRLELKNTIHKLIHLNNLPLSGIKMILTGGYSESGYEPAEPNLLITQQVFTLPSQSQIDKGIKVITHDYVREMPLVKSINYAMGIRLIKHIKANHAEDVLYHRRGVVTEFPRCNFFIVKQDNTVVTPGMDVLAGITRKNVIQLAGKKYSVKEGPVLIDDVLNAKEAFLTSTTKRIIPVVQVNENPIGEGKPGSITHGLLHDLVEFEKSYLALCHEN
jgi:branched-chain amino acid aminotransferase